MQREIQIKQFPIVTTHRWPKTRNERFVWENEQYLYRFFYLLYTTMSKWSYLSNNSNNFLKHHASDTPSVKRWRRVTDEWNGYMERSYRNTMHDSKRVCLKEVIIILE